MTSDRRGFTLIELLVAISIIGIISTFAVVSLSGARAKSRDARRVADMKQTSLALELYYYQAGLYPAVLAEGDPIVFEDIVYLAAFPTNPSPTNDGICPAEAPYVYTQLEAGKSYVIDFCLGGSIGGQSGPQQQTPAGLVSTVTSCSDISLECDVSCVTGDICGGGTIVRAADRLVAAPADAGSFVWDTAGSPAFQGATNTSDGRANETVLQPASNPDFSAARACYDFSANGFHNWYLPAQQELERAVNESVIDNSSYYWTSTELDAANAQEICASQSIPCPTEIFDSVKSNSYITHCFRRY